MTDTPNNTRDPEAVAVFLEESAEALQRLETLLIEAERGQPRHDMLEKLFRDVHSLKGNAGYLGYDISRNLAHAAEDLLSRLHDTKQQASASQCAVLLSAGDKLRQLIANIRASNEEGLLDVSALISDLRAAAAQESVPTAGSAAPTGEAALAAAVEANDDTVRIHVEVLDRLMNLTGELVLAGNQMAQVARTSGDASSHNQAVTQRLALAISQMQDQVMKTRMQPIARVFERLPRMVRNLEQACGKQVDIQVEGTSTELDRAVIETIRDPLMHIVRNAVDHGIETSHERVAHGKSPHGLLRVSASHAEGMIIIEVDDDGRGMDPKALREHAITKELLLRADAMRLSDQECIELIFRPGFSTAAQITDVSGRGVGMDVVRSQLEKAGGHVEIDTRLGQGTRIRMKVPLTLAVIPAMLVRQGQQQFAIPQASIVELISTEASAIEHVRGALVYRLRGQVLPLARLDALLTLDAHTSPDGKINIVVLQALGQSFGLLVDTIDNTEDIVIKALDGAIKRLGVYAGAATLASGGVALVLDAAGLGTRAGLASAQHQTQSVVPVQTSVPMTSMLMFRAGQNTLCAVPLSMVMRLEEVPSHHIERIAQRETLHYRGALLPIVRPEELLPLGEPQQNAQQPLIVLDIGRLVGIAVSEILDVIEAPLQVASTTAPLPYVLEQRILGNRTTLILDALKMAQDTGAGSFS